MRISHVICIAILATATSARAQTTHHVQLISVDFVSVGASGLPDGQGEDITIAVGDTVRWEWVSGGYHNVESGTIVSGSGVPDGFFTSGAVTNVAGTTYEVTFDQAFLDANPIANNVYSYYCAVHVAVDMKGTITVTTPECSTDGDCNDGDACNGIESCSSGSCVAGTALDCDDGNACTDDSCDASAGCQNVINDTNPCDDNKECTTGDACSNGVCTGTFDTNCCGTGEDCDDGNPCTDDLCDAAGGCFHANDDSNACDDNDPCTLDDFCSLGECVGTPSANCCESDADCDDNNLCSDDACNAGSCTHNFRSPCCTTDEQCIDDNPCTDDFCQDDICWAVANELACDDGVACTENDTCSRGLCGGTPTVDGCCSLDEHCDDGDECTDDACANNECVNTPIAGCEPTTTDPPDDGTGDPDGEMTGGGQLTSPCGASGMLPLLLLAISLATLRLRAEGRRGRRK